MVDENGNYLRAKTDNEFSVDALGFPIDQQNRLIETKEAKTASPPWPDDCGARAVVVSLEPANTGSSIEKPQLFEPKLVLTRDNVPIIRRPKYGRDNFFRNMLYGAGQYSLLFKGVFQSAPRAATPKEGMSNGGGMTNSLDFAPFIASRKSFDVDMTLQYDFPNFARWFSIGPYATFGASAVLSKNELEGETVKTEDQGQAGATDGPIIDAGEQAASDNDIKKFFEFGAQSSIRLYTNKLYLQSMIGYGNYEALDGLYTGHNTKHRFVGHLRIVPSGLNLDFGGQRTLAPIFGVDVNAGRGPDHLKFFSGFVLRIKGLQ